MYGRNWGEAGQRKVGIQWRQMHAGGGGILYLPFALTLGKEELVTRSNLGTSLVVQLRIHLPMQGTEVQFLPGELRPPCALEQLSLWATAKTRRSQIDIIYIHYLFVYLYIYIAF